MRQRVPARARLWAESMRRWPTELPRVTVGCGGGGEAGVDGGARGWGWPGRAGGGCGGGWRSRAGVLQGRCDAGAGPGRERSKVKYYVVNLVYLGLTNDIRDLTKGSREKYSLCGVVWAVSSFTRAVYGVRDTALYARRLVFWNSPRAVQLWPSGCGAQILSQYTSGCNTLVWLLYSEYSLAPPLREPDRAS